MVRFAFTFFFFVTLPFSAQMKLLNMVLALSVSKAKAKSSFFSMIVFCLYSKSTFFLSFFPLLLVKDIPSTSSSYPPPPFLFDSVPPTPQQTPPATTNTLQSFTKHRKSNILTHSQKVALAPSLPLPIHVAPSPTNSTPHAPPNIA